MPRTYRYGSGLVALLLITLLVVPGLAQDSAAPAPPDWKTLKAAYDYKPQPDLPVTVEAQDDAEYLRQRLAFPNGKGQTVPGLFLRPKEAGVYPCVLLLHGLTSNKETMINAFGKALAKQGIASLALDADRHGERKPADGNTLATGGDFITAFVNITREGILDYRLALDYLKTRKDVDSQRIGLLGYSMGAMMGSILSGVDARIQATALCVGGDMMRARLAAIPENLRARIEAVSPANYVGHISPRPTLFINGLQDTVVPKAAAETLQKAAKEPKEVIWAEAAHILPPAVAMKGVDWLVAKLKTSPARNGK